jgi:hypothetical protein
MTSGRLEFALFDKSADGWLAIEVYEQPLNAQSQDCVWTVDYVQVGRPVSHCSFMQLLLFLVIQSRPGFGNRFLWEWLR